MISTIRRTPIARAAAMLLIAVGLFAMSPAVAGAAPAVPECEVGNYATTMTLSANPPQGFSGDTIAIEGTGYPGSCELSVFVDGVQIGRVVTTPEGTFTIDWKIPPGAKPGPVTISTSVGGVTKTAIVDVRIKVAGTPTTVAPRTPGTTTLPRTGSDVLPLVAGGVALLVIGSLVILSSRKRSAHQI